ncbi:MAG TPA: response regulator transcription factor [Dermatophilaceae bacterium]|nr:response regulator transcription factor [Dermatophilaceae bacterium]
MTVRIAIIDDHTLVRSGIARLLGGEDDFEVVAEADSVAAGRAVLATHELDVILVDVSMPNGSGLELARQARASHPSLGIVILTMHSDDATLLEALDIGASALVLKSDSAEAVISAVRRAAVAPDAFTASGLAGAIRRRQAPQRPALTARQQEVLLLLVEGASVGQIARRLYMSESTVKTHIAKLYERLAARNRAEAVMSAVRMGLVPVPDGQPRA